MDEIMSFIHEGHEYPRQYLWGYDGFEKNDINMVPIEAPVGKKWIDKIGRMFKISLLRLQLKCIREAKDYDLIYINIDAFHIVLVLARLLRICKTPILAVSHHSFNYKILTKWRNRTFLRIHGFFYFHGIDKIVFCSERLLRLAQEGIRVPQKHCNFVNWGGDTNFYHPTTLNQSKSDTLKILSVGHTNRDYPSLLKAVTGLKCELKIHSLNSNIEEMTIPANVYVDQELKKERANNNYNRMTSLRDAYNWADVVAISIKAKVSHPNGATVLFESISCGKAVIVTNNVSLPIDVEQENIGLKVEYGDANGWKNAIQYFIENREECYNMGQNARKLAENHFNYDNYKVQLYKQMKDLMGE
jgi:glycosyltransferase involved in cell wall biosynthesis